uniref:ATP synthase subunit a n=1 Tax=Jenufa minuta TaxID=993092 RepID=A0A6G7ISZ5_JENMI|nr:ATP synthase F0 subunit 6 [Jenufa minuta]QII41627.1 ATP synthase F0 subunit 6 [Jenufa minuta]
MCICCNLKSEMIETIMLSSTENWNSVPLITIMLPFISCWMSNNVFCTLVAILIISSNHKRNHDYAKSSNDLISGLRKMIMNFWTTSILDRINLNLRSSTAYRSISIQKPYGDTVGDKTSLQTDSQLYSNRVGALWQAKSLSLYKTSYVLINILFFVIIISNFFGLIPFFTAITGNTGFTIGLSFAVWITVTVCGIICLKTQFVSLFLPSGLPFIMSPIFVLLEFISYTFRALSLGVRLFANMISGHELIHLVCAMALVPALCCNFLIGGPITLIASALLIALTGLEFIVCFLQAGVFCLLASFYLNEALHKKLVLAKKL